MNNILPEIAKVYCVTVDDLYKEQSVAYANYAQRLASVYEDSRKLEDFVRADLELIEKGLEEDEAVYFQTKQQRALFLSQIGEGNKVIDEQLAIISKRNCHVMEWVVLVAAACCTGENEKAYAYFQKALEHGVVKAELYCYGGDVCCELEKYEEAFSYWDKAIALDDSVMAAKYSKGFCYEKLGEYEKAKYVWSDIIEQLRKLGLDIEAKFVKERLRVCETML